MADENVLRGVSYPLQGRVRPSPFDTKERIRRLGLLDGCCMEYQATYEPCTTGLLKTYLTPDHAI